jgi:hypothetical protein
VREHSEPAQPHRQAVIVLRDATIHDPSHSALPWKFYERQTSRRQDGTQDPFIAYLRGTEASTVFCSQKKASVSNRANPTSHSHLSLILLSKSLRPKHHVLHSKLDSPVVLLHHPSTSWLFIQTTRPIIKQMH